MIRLALAWLALVVSAPAASAQVGPQGEAVVTDQGVSLRVLVHRPACPNPSLLIVFHGLHRNVESTRSAARPVADRLCMLLVIPVFDQERFPAWSYQRGGLVRGRRLQPRDLWTVEWVRRIALWATQMERRQMAVTLMGHSAGAQFLSRVMAYTNIPVWRAIIANPSTHVVPATDSWAPYGFGGLPSGEAELRAYLAKPVVIALGEEDTGDENLATSPEAMAQGANRLERGRNVYAAAVAAARARGIPLAWRLVQVPGTAHSARSMYNSAEVMAALGP